MEGADHSLELHEKLSLLAIRYVMIKDHHEGFLNNFIVNCVQLLHLGRLEESAPQRIKQLKFLLVTLRPSVAISPPMLYDRLLSGLHRTYRPGTLCHPWLYYAKLSEYFSLSQYLND